MAAADIDGTDTFLLTPLREGRPLERKQSLQAQQFLLTPLREGRPCNQSFQFAVMYSFLLTPLREGRRGRHACPVLHCYFYSRPCGRGDNS